MNLKTERTTYMGLPDSVRLSNGEADLVLTTAVGPRVLRYGFIGGPNMFGEYPELSTSSPLGEWKPYGGHRLWAAPENFDTTYAPDNVSVECRTDSDKTVHLTAPKDASGLRKRMTVRLAEQGTGVSVEHSITNLNGWAIRFAPWTITVHRGGTTILPREPFRSHDDCVDAAQPLTLWHFTDLQDSRFTLGSRYLVTRADPSRKPAQKIGIQNRQGWCAYHSGDTLLIKRFAVPENAVYPDCGSNNEAYTAGDYMETELLGPLCVLEKDAEATISESWELVSGVSFDPRDEESIYRAIAPHVPSGRAAGLAGSS
jgi:hypothetical protein